MQVTYTAERSKQFVVNSVPTSTTLPGNDVDGERPINKKHYMLHHSPSRRFTARVSSSFFLFFSFSIFSFFLYFVGGVTCHAEPLCKSLCRPALLKAQNKICGKQLLGTLQRLVFISELTLIEQRRLQFGQLIGQVVPLFQQLLLLCF